jgi:hypothetical protein
MQTVNPIMVAADFFNCTSGQGHPAARLTADEGSGALPDAVCDPRDINLPKAYLFEPPNSVSGKFLGWHPNLQ